MATRGWEHLTAHDLHALQPRPKPTKYRNIKKTVNGVVFDSTKEANRYIELLALAQAQQIRCLEVQPRFELWAAQLRTTDHFVSCYVGEYVADFRYVDAVRGVVIEDIKSSATRTPLYRLKKKIAEACHGIVIEER